MACIDNKTWQVAKAACAARLSVKGVGEFYGFRGLGDLVNINTSSAADPNDPCTIAAQTPCPVFSTPVPYKPTVVTPTVATASAVGGFSHWGLLAALAAAGGAVYLITKKKSSPS